MPDTHPQLLPCYAAARGAVRPGLVTNTFLFMVCVLFLSGCGRARGELELLPSDATAAETQSVIVATSRAPVKGPPYYSNQRSYTTHFSLMEISVPPDRKVGTAPLPKGNTADPRRHFLVASHERLSGEQGYLRAIREQVASGSRDGAVLVHGYNTNFAEAVITEAQFTYDLGKRDAVNILYSWPSAAKVTQYLTDRESVLFARDSLAQTISATSKSNLSSYLVVGHSMGTFLVMETLRSMVLAEDNRTLRKIDAVVLISADLDIDVFRKQADVVLAAGLPIFIVVSDDDKALALSALLRGQKNRVGSVRSRDELGGIDVFVVDLSEIDDGGRISHSKAAESEMFLEYMQGLNRQGVNVFSEQGQPGLFQTGVLLVQQGSSLAIVE